MGRRKERELAFYLIFEDMFSQGDEEKLEIFNENVEPVSDYTKTIYEGVAGNREELDNCISEFLNGWKLSRISKVTHSILLLAAYEIKYVDEVPVSVSINEAVELAKKFAGKDEASFINGVLGALARSTE